MKQMINYATRDEWLEGRKKGIGASEVASVLGLSPWETAYQLWQYKLGMLPPKEENFVMKAGHLLEDAVANFYADATGAQIIKSSAVDFMYIDTDIPYIRVSPDRTYWAKGATHNTASKCILECKTTQMKIDADQLPMHWFCQLQANLGISGFKHGALAWLTQGREFGYKEIDFDPDFFAWMVSKVGYFWQENVLKQIEPDAVNAGDTLLKFPKHSVGKTLEATQGMVDELKQLKEINEQIKELQAGKTALEDALKMEMEDAEAIVSQGITLVTWKAPKESMKFNEKRFSTEHPEEWKAYREPVQGSRRFLVK